MRYKNLGDSCVAYSVRGTSAPRAEFFVKVLVLKQRRSLPALCWEKTPPAGRDCRVSGGPRKFHGLQVADGAGGRVAVGDKKRWVTKTYMTGKGIGGKGGVKYEKTSEGREVKPARMLEDNTVGKVLRKERRGLTGGQRVN